MARARLSREDAEHLRQVGIDEQEARRQLQLLDQGTRHPRLLRAATLGDGIRRLPESSHKELLAKWAEARRQGRVSRFVPASGAATRMFAFLEKVAAGRASPEDLDLLGRFCREIERFPFYSRLRELLEIKGLSLPATGEPASWLPVVEALLESSGLGYRLLPKALIPFHRYGSETRTALEEHLVEAALTVTDRRRRCRVHFTADPAWAGKIEAHAREAARLWGQRLGVEFDLGVSVQEPCTQTLAIDGEGHLARHADGRLRLRPGGHGALLHNLNALAADIVFIANVDNIAHDHHRREAVNHQRLLIGVFAEMEQRIARCLHLLEAGDVGELEIGQICEFVSSQLNLNLPEDFGGYDLERQAEWLYLKLNRPLRVCGMVVNEGEPGGGPFWVADRDGGSSLQIVERAQVDASDPVQVEIFFSATHFNPVQIVCGLRDHHGSKFDLLAFRDPEAIFVTSKVEDGRQLRVLEHPGLWNGGMAFWNTIFVEVPRETFNPVKTVVDLLRPRHQPQAGTETPGGDWWQALLADL